MKPSFDFLFLKYVPRRPDREIRRLFFVAGWRGAREGIKGREPRKKKNVYMWALDHV